MEADRPQTASFALSSSVANRESSLKPSACGSAALPAKTVLNALTTLDSGSSRASSSAAEVSPVASPD
jgi:hypothetical protein